MQKDVHLGYGYYVKNIKKKWELELSTLIKKISNNLGYINVNFN